MLWGWLQMAGTLLPLSAAELPEEEIPSQSPPRVTHLPCDTLLFLAGTSCLLHALSSSCRATHRVHVQTQASRLVPSPPQSTFWTFDRSQRNQTHHLSLWYRVNINSTFIFTVIQGTTFNLTTSTCKLGTVLCIINLSSRRNPGISSESVQDSLYQESFFKKICNFSYSLTLN